MVTVHRSSDSISGTLHHIGICSHLKMHMWADLVLGIFRHWSPALNMWRRCRLLEYFAIMTLINQTGITVFRAIAAIGRAVVLCNVLAFIYIAYALLFCGFIIPIGAESCSVTS